MRQALATAVRPSSTSNATLLPGHTPSTAPDVWVTISVVRVDVELPLAAADSNVAVKERLVLHRVMKLDSRQKTHSGPLSAPRFVAVEAPFAWYVVVSEEWARPVVPHSVATSSHRVILVSVITSAPMVTELVSTVPPLVTFVAD